MSMFRNPFRPGAGHMPPYLAGREAAVHEVLRYLQQDVILTNVVLTGLRGVGKTVLLETIKPQALTRQWQWVGTDLSESASISEEKLATRLLADLAVVTSSIPLTRVERQAPGFMTSKESHLQMLDFDVLRAAFSQAPGLTEDKLKAVLEWVWQQIPPIYRGRGIAFAYDEAQNLADHAQKEQYPLSMLLDVFQSVQKKGLPYLLVLTGLPTLFPKLVEARTYAERMFHLVVLDRLSDAEGREAITRPTADPTCPVRFDEDTVAQIVSESAGYPYFVQFFAREVFDVFVAQEPSRRTAPIAAIVNKLDADFFAGRWAKATDRQRALMSVIATLPNAEGEFAVQDIVNQSRQIGEKPFSPSHANQMLAALAASGLIYKNRHGRYSFAVPLLARFIRRQGSNA
ncbi:MAG: ATP-binding protein [Burkholderiaceae bacterium]|jgi:hypothetical protein|nr:ATP-binding protein [Burkholderiaceae bacterium]